MEDSEERFVRMCACVSHTSHLSDMSGTTELQNCCLTHSHAKPSTHISNVAEPVLDIQTKQPVSTHMYTPSSLALGFTSATLLFCLLKTPPPPFPTSTPRSSLRWPSMRSAHTSQMTCRPRCALSSSAAGTTHPRNDPRSPRCCSPWSRSYGRRWTGGPHRLLH